MTAPVLGLCDRVIAPGTVPEWIDLFPEGPTTGRDGRKFVLADPDAVIAAFQSGGIDLPVDYEHQNDRPEAKLSGPVPAAGWIKELRRDAGHLWGRVEWTATAAEMIRNREYRYVSPSFLYHPKTLDVVRLKGAGLVHNPNLHLTALASEAPPMPDPAAPPANDATPDVLTRVAEALGLPPDSPAEAVLRTFMAALLGKSAPAAATAQQQPDPARYVPIEALCELKAERDTWMQAHRQAEADEKVTRALREGHITPAMKGWATALCMQDPDSFDSFLAKSPAIYASLTRPLNLTLSQGEPGARGAASDAAAAVCAQLGLKPDALN